MLLRSLSCRNAGAAAIYLRRWVWILLGWLLVTGHCEATTYILPPDGQSLVGKLQQDQVRPGETLLDIARRYSVGLVEMQDANPGVDAWLPSVGQRVVIPTQHLLPDVPREGIVVNLPELRLYYYPPAMPGTQRVVMTYPLGIGSEGRAIPVAETRVIEKKVDPPWVVPDSILAEHEAEGDPLPKVVPPGPDNPLGRYALRLGLSSFLIHSTNHPFSVGMRISHGCLRMYPENIEELFNKVAVGTPVRIIDAPYKVGWQGGVLYLEAHPPLAEAGHTPSSNLTPMVVAVTDVVSSRLDDPAWQAAARVATQGSGIPTPIFAQPPDMAQGNERKEMLSKQTWMVQVGVFRSLSGAERVAKMMRRLDLPVVASTVDESRPCRVLVGPFASREAAASTGDKIYKDTGLENFLVPTDHFSSVACQPKD
jgi:L,D-transpeptidase ErfK/SrfK